MSSFVGTRLIAPLPLRTLCAKGPSLPSAFLGDSLVHRSVVLSILTLVLLGTAACHPLWDQGGKDRQEPLGSERVCRDDLSDPDVLGAHPEPNEALRTAFR